MLDLGLIMLGMSITMILLSYCESLKEFFSKVLKTDKDFY